MSRDDAFWEKQIKLGNETKQKLKQKNEDWGDGYQTGLNDSNAEIKSLLAINQIAVEALEKVKQRCAEANFPMVRTDLLFVPEALTKIAALKANK